MCKFWILVRNKKRIAKFVFHQVDTAHLNKVKTKFEEVSKSHFVIDKPSNHFGGYMVVFANSGLRVMMVSAVSLKSYSYRSTLTPVSSPSPTTGRSRRYRGAGRHLPLPCSDPSHPHVFPPISYFCPPSSFGLPLCQCVSRASPTFQHPFDGLVYSPCVGNGLTFLSKFVLFCK